jgi:hypothetical protein
MMAGADGTGTAPILWCSPIVPLPSHCRPTTGVQKTGDSLGLSYKHTIGSTLRARQDDGQGGEAAIAVHALNRMIRIAKPISVRRA